MPHAAKTQINGRAYTAPVLAITGTDRKPTGNDELAAEEESRLTASTERQAAMHTYIQGPATVVIILLFTPGVMMLLMAAHAGRHCYPARSRPRSAESRKELERHTGNVQPPGRQQQAWSEKVILGLSTHE